jgi:hypothetical protein
MLVVMLSGVPMPPLWHADSPPSGTKTFLVGSVLDNNYVMELVL